jgi:hypothetical protein
VATNEIVATPDIVRSVLSTERFSVVTRPIGIIAIVAILPPTYGSLRHMDSSKIQINQLSWAARLIFPRDAWLKVAVLDAGLAGAWGEDPVSIGGKRPDGPGCSAI